MGGGAPKVTCERCFIITLERGGTRGDEMLVTVEVDLEDQKLCRMGLCDMSRQA
jgi:hypothetical protein